MGRESERATLPLHIHFGDRTLEDSTRDFIDVATRVERGEAVEPQRHLSFEGWDTFQRALCSAGLDDPTSATVITVLKDLAGAEERPLETGETVGSTRPWDRSSLANARRKWRHYQALGDRAVPGQLVAEDLAPIVPAFEAACDEVDRLRLQIRNTAVPATFSEGASPADVEAYDEVLRPDEEDVMALTKMEREVLQREVLRLREDCAEAYQVVGALGAAAGVMGAPQFIKALDNLSAASLGDARPHKDLLPFVLDP
jgi:hypothetical protein